MTKKIIIETIRAYMPSLKKDFYVKDIQLFGTYATYSFDEDSDIDLLVSFDKPIGLKFFSLGLYLESLFNRKVDLVTEKALNPFVKDTIGNNMIKI